MEVGVLVIVGAPCAEPIGLSCTVGTAAPP
jgi:hypothetical protein